MIHDFVLLNAIRELPEVKGALGQASDGIRDALKPSPAPGRQQDSMLVPPFPKSIRQDGIKLFRCGKRKKRRSRIDGKNSDHYGSIPRHWESSCNYA
jgi:hypothetical protein